MLQRYTRRSLLLDVGRLTMGALVLGAAACTADEGDGAAPGASDAPDGEATEPPRPTPTGPDPSGAPPVASTWERVDLGFVSAYVLVRDGEAVLVDTGIGGSADAIGAVLEGAGSRWEDLADVVLTHRHPDHAGSVAEVVDRAPETTVWVGRGDLDAVAGIVEAQPVDDGAAVAGLRIVATPGHTPGHVAVLDPASGVLLAGDAINGTDAGGDVTGPNPRFSEDMDAARASVRTLAGLTYEVVLFGHGEPVTVDGSAAVGALADSLGV